jgi:hypothetical protein
MFNSGNISIRARYGKQNKILLYCKHCGKTFAATT